MSTACPKSCDMLHLLNTVRYDGFDFPRLYITWKSLESFLPFVIINPTYLSFGTSLADEPPHPVHVLAWGASKFHLPLINDGISSNICAIAQELDSKARMLSEILPVLRARSNQSWNSTLFRISFSCRLVSPNTLCRQIREPIRFLTRYR